MRMRFVAAHAKLPAAPANEKNYSGKLSLALLNRLFQQVKRVRAFTCLQYYTAKYALARVAFGEAAVRR